LKKPHDTFAPEQWKHIMPEIHRGRIAPTSTPPFSCKPAYSFNGAWWWNAPREAVSHPVFVPGAQAMKRFQEATDKMALLPLCLRVLFQRRYQFIWQEKGWQPAQHFLLNIFLGRLWPRIQKVNQQNCLKRHLSLRFTAEEETYNRLPDLNKKNLARLAWKIASQCHEAHENLCEKLLAKHPDAPDILLLENTQKQIFAAIAGMARALNVTPLHWGRFCKGKLDTQASVASLSRLVSADWWTRQLLSQQTRWREALMIAGGFVSRMTSAYASQNALRETRSRRLSTLNYLRNCDLENEQTGERISLLDTVMSSISNPAIRRMELMTMIAGVEKVASLQGDGGLFITLTTPSKYHPTRTAGRQVQLNANWDKQASSPKDAQRYLVAIWAKIRTAFKDRKINIYGVRVVEPHHDGTPHWHLLLFTTPVQQAAAIEIMRRYALMEDGDEPGASRNRFDCKPLNRGGAAAYIAKYISKNIDGYALEGETDFDSGKLLTDTAAAVTAWASTWRIPQFHPIGLPSVGAYRECRRIRDISLACSFGQPVEDVRLAADCGDYAAYILAQGGTNVSRTQQTVRVARKASGRLNAFQEERLQVVGIYSPHLGAEHCYLTRSSRWRILRRTSQANVLKDNSQDTAPRSSVINCGKSYVIPAIEKCTRAPAGWRKSSFASAEIAVYTLTPSTSISARNREKMALNQTISSFPGQTVLT